MSVLGLHEECDQCVYIVYTEPSVQQLQLSHLSPIIRVLEGSRFTLKDEDTHTCIIVVYQACPNVKSCILYTDFYFSLLSCFRV